MEENGNKRDVDTIYNTIYNSKEERMSQWDKLIDKIIELSNDLKFEELRKVLEAYGYVMNTPSGGSSHCVFRKEGCKPITIPKHRYIKKVYVKMVREIVEKEGKTDENNRRLS